MRVKAKKSPRWGMHPARPGANSVAAVVAGILGAGGLAVTGSAHGQAATVAAPQLPTTAQTSQNLQEVVVTATATAVKKIDASYNIVSADRDLIKQANPLSSADILKIAPGIWPEASGGQTGANIEVAGLPSGGDSPFFTNMVQGLPLYGAPNLSFMGSSSLFRLDNTIQRVEITQFGPSVIFGTEHMWRTDAFYGFPIGEGWYGSIGGFYRVSNGVRPSQFPSDNGGQLTGTLKHDLDGGSLVFWARVLDDKNQFIAPIPVIEAPDG